MSRLGRLPNLITFLNVIFGFAAVASLIQGVTPDGVQTQAVGRAAWFILIAALLDAMDGKLARAIGHQSEFGKELDSLSDAVSFGLAPSVLLYTLEFRHWAERGELFGLAGFLISAMPLTFGCFRLARFNVETVVEGKKSAHFAGLPIPASAGLIVSYVLFFLDINNELGSASASIQSYPSWQPGILPLALVASFLMISRVRFEGMPYFSLRQGNRNLTRLVLFVSLVGSILFLQAKALFPAASAYLVWSLAKHLKGQPDPAMDVEDEDGDWTDNRHL